MVARIPCVSAFAVRHIILLGVVEWHQEVMVELVCGVVC